MTMNMCPRFVQCCSGMSKTNTYILLYKRYAIVHVADL